MISYLLLYKILQLFIVLVLGFLLVKFKVIRESDGTVLSKISLYMLMPAAIINSFDVELTPELAKGIGLAYIAAVVIHIVLLGIDAIYKRAAHGTSAERASVMYSNAANLIIPIVSFVLGEEWVIYSCAFMSVQLVFIWSHGIRMFSENEKFNIKKILLNVNIIAIAVGVVFMLCGIRLPVFVKDITSSLGGMLGNVGMLIAGILAAQVDFKKMIRNKRLYLVLAMRMIVCPAVVLVILKIIGSFAGIANAENILLVSFLAAMTPAAATVMQFAQLSGRDADFAVAVNIATTVVCIATMPAFVAIYSM
ncbi:MAG: AEC family transporter [Oscillospiraceae bacterium]|nr:AEC family transporter [Oscillospiraceae bacterium]MBR2181668.1 AEC family transporter [Oscillospiraceae bacterium]